MKEFLKRFWYGAKAMLIIFAAFAVFVVIAFLSGTFIGALFGIENADVAYGIGVAIALVFMCGFATAVFN